MHGVSVATNMAEFVNMCACVCIGKGAHQVFCIRCCEELGGFACLVVGCVVHVVSLLGCAVHVASCET